MHRTPHVNTDGKVSDKVEKNAVHNYQVEYNINITFLLLTLGIEVQS